MLFVGYMGQFNKFVCDSESIEGANVLKSWNVCFSDGFPYLFGTFTAFYTSSERHLQHIVCSRRSRTSATGKEKRANNEQGEKADYASFLTCGFHIFRIKNFF